MATIEALNPSILTLNPTEQLSLIKRMRLSRRTTKFKKKKAKTTKRKTKIVNASPKELFKLLSKEQKAMMLKELMGLN